MRDSKTRYWRMMDRDSSITYDNIETLRPSYMNALSNRNYTLFGILSGVRWRPVKDLFGHRGMPKDASKATVKELVDGDNHSHTYFTLQELLNTDWDAVACHEEMAYFADQFVHWKDTGEIPTDLDEATYIGHRGHWHKDLKALHRQVTEEEMTLLLLTAPIKKLVRFRKNKLGGGKERVGTYVSILSPRTYRDLVPDFVNSIEDMKALGPPDRVRVVIAYDN